MTSPDELEVLNAATRVVESVRDGTLKILKKHTLAGREVWDVRHVPENSDLITEAVMRSLRHGQISVTPTSEGNAYTLDIYGGKTSFMKEDGIWTEVELNTRPNVINQETMRRVIEQMREQKPNVMIMGAQRQFDDRTLVVSAVDPATREELIAIVSLSVDGQDVQDVRFQDDTAGFEP